MIKTYQKCNNCQEKPATIICQDCKNESQNKPTKFCYLCHKTIHNTPQLQSHKKDIIKYHNLAQQQTDQSSILDQEINLIEEFHIKQDNNSTDQNYFKNLEAQKQNFFDQQQSKEKGIIHQNSIQQHSQHFNSDIQFTPQKDKALQSNQENSISTNIIFDPSTSKKDQSQQQQFGSSFNNGKNIQQQVDSIKKQLQEQKFSELFTPQKSTFGSDSKVQNQNEQNSSNQKNYSRSENKVLKKSLKQKSKQEQENIACLQSLKESQIKNIELKYKVKFQSMENIIKIQNEQIQELKQQNLDITQQMTQTHRKDQIEKSKKIEELIKVINEERKSREDREEKYKKEAQRQKQVLQDQLENILKEHNYVLSELKEGYDKQIQELQDKVKQKNEYTKDQENKIRKHIQNQNDQRDIIQDYENSEKILKKQIKSLKNEIKALKKEIELINETHSLEFEEYKRIKYTNSQLNAKVEKYHQIIYGKNMNNIQ